MQHDDATAKVAQIEADLAKDRATVADTIDALRARLTVDSLIADAGVTLADNIAPLTAALDRTVRANPLAVALIGAGVAWLALGGRSRKTATASVAGSRYDALMRWEDEGGPSHDLPLDDDMSWAYESDALRDRARAALSRIEASAKAGFSTVARTAEARAEVIARYATDANLALRRGLEGLPQSVQDWIAVLREQIYRAPRAAIAARQRLIEDRPVVAGAVAFAVGAGLAAALPRTLAEDRLFGAERDRLVDHAQAVLRAERSRASDVVADLAGTTRAEPYGAAPRYPHAVGS